MGGLPSTFRRREHRQQLVVEPGAFALYDSDAVDETPPDARDERGRTALHRAAEEGDEAQAGRLLARGASVNAADNRGETPLVAAAAGAGSARLCEMLANYGADLGARDRLGRTALHAAAEAKDGGRAVTLKLLLRRGANPQAQDICGRYALHCALEASNLAAAEVLVPGVTSMLHQDDTGRTPLHWAAVNATPEMVRWLIERDSGAWAVRDSLGMTPLARALKAGKRETAAVLVEACPRPPVGGADACGMTELHWAAYAGYPAVVQRLLKCGYSSWAVDHWGRNVVTWAVESGKWQVVYEILEAVGYYECLDEQGQSALHLAAIKGDATVVSLLLDRGANAARKDSKGYTALYYALRERHGDAVCLLSNGGLFSEGRQLHRERTLLHWAAVSGDVDAVRELLERGAWVSDVDGQGKTAVALAIEHGHDEAAALLVADDDFRVTRDSEGRTQLHAAASAGLSQVALQLIAMGEDPHYCQEGLLSPVELAMEAGHKSLADAMERAVRPSEQKHSDSS